MVVAPGEVTSNIRERCPSVAVQMAVMDVLHDVCPAEYHDAVVQRLAQNSLLVPRLTDPVRNCCGH